MRPGDLVKHTRLYREPADGCRPYIGIVLRHQGKDQWVEGLKVSWKKVYWFGERPKPASIVSHEELSLYGKSLEK